MSSAFDIQGETTLQGLDTRINTGAKTFNISSIPGTGFPFGGRVTNDNTATIALIAIGGVALYFIAKAVR